MKASPAASVEDLGLSVLGQDPNPTRKRRRHFQLVCVSAGVVDKSRDVAIQGYWGPGLRCKLHRICFECSPKGLENVRQGSTLSLHRVSVAVPNRNRDAQDCCRVRCCRSCCCRGCCRRSYQCRRQPGKSPDPTPTMMSHLLHSRSPPADQRNDHLPNQHSTTRGEQSSRAL